MSRIRADRYTNRAGTGAPTFADGVNVVGITSVKAGAGVTSLEVTGDLSVISGTIKGSSQLSISGITSSISDTAVDVFVYDTNKDSDGGAWRKRTQNTSWYNETLNTSTRGSRKEFPAVAVIVLESLRLKIYDGDDPDLPLWMEFINTSGNLIGGSAMTSVTALNGIIVTGSGGYCMETRFISDYSIDWFQNQLFEYNGNIEQRNDTLGFKSIASYGIVSSAVNNVAMTVLPNAPVDDATGLPVPTIAVATDGGISVIKDNGTVVDNTRSVNETYSIAFDIDNSLIFSWGTTDNFPRHITRLITSVWEIASSNTSLWPNNYFSGYNEGLGNGAGSSGSAAGGVVTVANSGRHFGIEYGNGGNTDDRLGILHPRNLTNYANQNLSAFITSSYNTGYMHGDIKGAFLSDISTANVTGSNLIDATAASWTTFNGTGTVTNPSTGVVATTDTDGNYVTYQDVTNTVVGKQYILSYDTNAARETYFEIRDTSAAVIANGNQFNYTGTYTGPKFIKFTATTTTTRIMISDGSGGGLPTETSDLQLRLVDPDRSVNNSGAQVFGTVTKSAVATGAELVAYSGFTASNYLKYNASDMAFGIGDFSVSVWCIPSTDQSNEFILELDDSSAQRFYFLVTNTTTKRLYLPWNADVAGSELTTGQWNHVVVGRRSGTGFVYVNGDNIPAGSVAWSGDLEGKGFGTISNYSGGPANNYAWSGSLALLRISGSAPSAAQVKKMYDDEKHLFQENAKATLYGSSDAVTALAYDDTTELLHVGTSAGRSEFQGLRRINNTTTAVTTAISASNELVAEQ